MTPQRNRHMSPMNENTFLRMNLLKLHVIASFIETASRRSHIRIIVTNPKVTLSWNRTASISELDDFSPHLNATPIPNEPFPPRVTDIAPFTETSSRRSHARIIIITPVLF
jgi:hypothetical protein